MSDKLNVRQAIGAMLIRGGQRIMYPQGMHHVLRFNNTFVAELYREGKFHKRFKGHNDVTVVGKNHMLDVTFGNTSPVTQVDPWYIGLINQSPVPTLSENDTLASHAGWTELTAYTGNRKAWTDANASAKVKGTTTVSTFVMNATNEVNGIFVASVDTGTSGILWATGSFDAAIDVVNTDELKITYGVRL